MRGMTVKEDHNKDMRIAHEIESICKIGFTGTISEELACFLMSWLEAGESGCEEAGVNTQKIWSYLINMCPSEDVPDVLYRGCKSVQYGRVESYTPSHDIATKFAGREGHLIVVDKECLHSNQPIKAFDFAGFLGLLHEVLIEANTHNNLVDFMEMWACEREYLLFTNNEFCVYKSLHKPEHLLEEAIVE